VGVEPGALTCGGGEWGARGRLPVGPALPDAAQGGVRGGRPPPQKSFEGAGQFWPETR
jgi:hypothetical protein